MQNIKKNLCSLQSINAKKNVKFRHQVAQQKFILDNV